MVTLAFAQMAYFIFHDTKLGGGSDGIYLNVKPVLAGVLDLKSADAFYFFALGALAATYALLARCCGRASATRWRASASTSSACARRASATYGYKLAAFVLAGALAGLAGFLIAVRDGFVNPEMLAWQESGTVLLMLILGGLGHLRGAVLGALVFTLLKELYSSEALGRAARRPLAIDARADDHRVRRDDAEGLDRPAGALRRRPRAVEAADDD